VCKSRGYHVHTIDARACVRGGGQGLGDACALCTAVLMSSHEHLALRRDDWRDDWRESPYWGYVWHAVCFFTGCVSFCI
jgi:hypothetical protein